MDGAMLSLRTLFPFLPGGSFGERPLPPRCLDPGMGVAVARRTVFRPDDAECFGRVADRVAAGNMALLGRQTEADRVEQARLRNAIATGALITAGRHLQHGDAAQPGRNMELFTNCATAITSFAKFYLLLNGSGVGRSYDDELIVVDWAEAPLLRLRLDRTHPDFPHSRAELARFGQEFALLPPGTTPDSLTSTQEAMLRAWVDAHLCTEPVPGAVVHRLGQIDRAVGEHGLRAPARRYAAARFLRHPPARYSDPRHAGPPGLGAAVADPCLPLHR
jgi:hypothetical protein